MKVSKELQQKNSDISLEGSQGNRTEVSCPELQILESKPIEVESSDDEIEIINKPKRLLSEKQKEALANAREKRKVNIQTRNEEKQKIQEQQKKETEQKIVKKAIAIKKKQIKIESLVNLTPDEEEAYDEPVKTPVRKTPAPSRNPPKQPESVKPRIIFM